MSLTREQLEADVAFLVLRARCAGSAYFGADRWTGMSSNALVDLAYGGEQTAMPSDRSDYAACVRTYARLPVHRRTKAVREGLKRAREAYLSRYPEDRFPAARISARAERLAEWARRRTKTRRRA